MKDYYQIADRVNNSAIGWFLISPQYFKAKLDGLVEEEQKSYFQRGQRIHMYLLEPIEFEHTYIQSNVDLPRTDQERKFCEEYIKSTKNTEGEKALEAYSASYIISGLKPETIAAKGLEKIKKLKPYISLIKSGKSEDHLIKSDELEWYKKIEELVRQNKKAKELIYPQNDPLFGGKLEVLTEYPILWDYKNEYQGIKVPCKGLLDRVVIDHDNKVIKLVDVKTTQSLGQFPKKSFIDYDYGRQLSWYWQALDGYFETRVDFKELSTYKRETYIVGISTDRSLPGVEVFRIDDKILSKRGEFIDDTIKEICWHWTNNCWEHSRTYYENEGLIDIREEATE